jgi:hypothetical protein
MIGWMFPRLAQMLSGNLNRLGKIAEFCGLELSTEAVHTIRYLPPWHHRLIDFKLPGYSSERCVRPASACSRFIYAL